MAGRNELLKAAYPLIKNHGFTRQTLALSALSLPKAHTAPLSDTAINALFGRGDDARRTLISSWLEHASEQMRTVAARQSTPTMKDVLAARLDANEPVLRHLPEAFALLATPTTSFGPANIPVPLLDPRPALLHAGSVAMEACRVAGDRSNGTSWYARRASLAAIYTAAELHQFTSPATAHDFLSSLLDASAYAKSVVGDVDEFARYVFRSWGGIIRSSGVLL